MTAIERVEHDSASVQKIAIQIMALCDPGCVYTPAPVARAMVRRGLAACAVRGDSPNRNARGPLVVDPACGDGAFLLELFDSLCQGACDWQARLNVVSGQIFGVDKDPGAVAAVRSSLLARIAPEPAAAEATRAKVAANIQWGDSLAGADFAEAPVAASPATVPLMPRAASGRASHAAEAPPLNWNIAFPSVAAAGGFDLVIGNPPYLRERNAKSMFDAVAGSALGKRWREARMDYWFYFLHRGLDLLNPGGVLSYIVNSYWIASRGARKLIRRLQTDVDFEEIMTLGDAPVFPGVVGRHLIFRLRKKPTAFDEPQVSADNSHAGPMSSPGRPAAIRMTTLASGCDLFDALEAACPLHAAQAIPSAEWETYLVQPEDLFQHGRIVVAPADPLQALFENRRTLGELYETRQGMAENPPAINRKLFNQSGAAYRLGEGVFVLTAHEVARLELSAGELALLRPYYETSSLGRYRIPLQPTHHVLYLTRTTAPSLKAYPRLFAHLSRFRPILERRREVREGRYAWWWLHWPREETIFLKPRVLCVQMGPAPQFVAATPPTFVGFSVNVLLDRAGGSAFDLETLSGILNSSLAARWFGRHAKHRGVKLEINAHVLRQFPLPDRCAAIEPQILELVRRRQAATIGQLNAPNLNQLLRKEPVSLGDSQAPAEIESLERERPLVPQAAQAPIPAHAIDAAIDDLVSRLYGAKHACPSPP